MRCEVGVCVYNDQRERMRSQGCDLSSLLLVRGSQAVSVNNYRLTLS